MTWGVAKGGKPVMFRRLKLYLSPLSRAAWNQPGLAWQDLAAGAVVVEVDGRGAMGSPACGTAPARWRPQD